MKTQKEKQKIKAEVHDILKEIVNNPEMYINPYDESGDCYQKVFDLIKTKTNLNDDVADEFTKTIIDMLSFLITK